MYWECRKDYICCITATPCSEYDDCLDHGDATCVSGYCQEDCETTAQCVHGQVCSQEKYRNCLCEFVHFHL